MSNEKKLIIAKAAMERALQLCANRDYLDLGILDAAQVLTNALAMMEDES